jgi:hypothetical protein
MRVSWLLIAFAAGCTASESAPATQFGQPPPSLMAAGAAAAAPETSTSTDAEVAALRAELATGDDPAAAALALAELDDANERPADGLAAVDAALRRRPGDRRLRLLRVELLRDLGRRHVAVAELAQLLAEPQGADLPPILFLDLAQMAWLEGDRQQAASALAVVQSRGRGQSWYAAQAETIAELHGEVAAGGRPQRIAVRDLFGNLRAAPTLAEREHACRELIAVGGLTRARALAIAGDDPEPRLRGIAIQLADVDMPSLCEVCRLGLADSSPVVRAIAAGRARELPGERGADMLFAALAVESDAAAFAIMHHALHTLVPAGPELAAREADSTDGRAAVVAAWRQRWGR